MFYGCKPPKKDLRDYQMKASSIQGLQLPETFCLKKPQKIKNQGTVGSCVAHATSSILEYHDKGNHKLSTAFIYGIQHDVCGNDGPGMYLNDACKIVKNYGDMLEEDCKGNYEFPKAIEVAAAAYADREKLNRAYEYRIDSFYSCLESKDIKYAIYTYGPVLASVLWYDKATVDQYTSVINFDTNSDSGYHAIMIIGWDKNGFICQNSWGTTFGNLGYFVYPYSYRVAEAKAFIDYENPQDKSLVKPINNPILNVFYKIANWFLNLFN